MQTSMGCSLLAKLASRGIQVQAIGKTEAWVPQTAPQITQQTAPQTARPRTTAPHTGVSRVASSSQSSRQAGNTSFGSPRCTSGRAGQGVTRTRMGAVAFAKAVEPFLHGALPAGDTDEAVTTRATRQGRAAIKAAQKRQSLHCRRSPRLAAKALVAAANTTNASYRRLSSGTSTSRVGGPRHASPGSARRSDVFMPRTPQSLQHLADTYGSTPSTTPRTRWRSGFLTPKGACNAEPCTEVCTPRANLSATFSTMSPSRGSESSTDSVPSVPFEDRSRLSFSQGVSSAGSSMGCLSCNGSTSKPGKIALGTGGTSASADLVRTVNMASCSDSAEAFAEGTRVGVARLSTPAATKGVARETPLVCGGSCSIETATCKEEVEAAPFLKAEVPKPVPPADTHTSSVATSSSALPPVQKTNEQNEAGDASGLEAEVRKPMPPADMATSSSTLPVQTAEESGQVPPSPEQQQPEGRAATPCPKGRATALRPAATPRMTISLATLKRRRSQSGARDPPRRRVRQKGAEEKCVIFATGAESCSICCTEHVDGSKMVRLACTHGWYCLECMARYAQSRLEVGAVELTCPECSTAIAEHDLRKMVPAEIVERLLQRSLERAVSCDANLKACPTPGCPMRVALEDGVSARLSCPLCKKTSCVRCGAQPWHRSMSCEEYAKKPRPNAKTKGRCRGAAAAAMTAESNEEALRKWMAETGTRQCPTCGMAVSKQNLGQQQTQRSECHKMMCRNCNCRFCFKCLAILTASFSCGCTSDLHGFINPKSGRRVSQHLRHGGNSKQRGP